jgi:hypothetical protein
MRDSNLRPLQAGQAWGTAGAELVDTTEPLTPQTYRIWFMHLWLDQLRLGQQRVQRGSGCVGGCFFTGGDIQGDRWFIIQYHVYMYTVQYLNHITLAYFYNHPPTSVPLHP